MREWLEWKRPDSWNTTSKPIPRPASACVKLAGGQRTVPVLVEDGKVIQVGWQGRSCVVDAE